MSCVPTVFLCFILAPPEPEVIVDEIPSNRLELGDLGPVFVRLPNFLSIEPKPFDERTYDAEMDDDDVVDMEGRSRMKLKVCFEKKSINNCCKKFRLRTQFVGEMCVIQKQARSKKNLMPKLSNGPMERE